MEDIKNNENIKLSDYYYFSKSLNMWCSQLGAPSCFDTEENAIKYVKCHLNID